MSHFQCNALIGLIGLALLGLGSSLAFAKLPTEEEMRGVQTACGGGSVKAVQGAVQGKLNLWRKNAEATGDAKISDLVGLLGQTPPSHEVNPENYKAYVNCIIKLTKEFLQTSSARENNLLNRISEINLNQSENYIHQIFGQATYSWSRPYHFQGKRTNDNGQIYIIPDYNQLTFVFDETHHLIAFSVYSSSDALSNRNEDGGCIVGCKTFAAYGYNTYFHRFSSKDWYYGESDCRPAYSGAINLFRCEACFLDFTSPVMEWPSLKQGDSNVIPETEEWNKWRQSNRPEGFAVYFTRFRHDDTDRDYSDDVPMIFHDARWILTIGGGPGVKWQ